MKTSFRSVRALSLVLISGACASALSLDAQQSAPPGNSSPTLTPATDTTTTPAQHTYSAADVKFFDGMIPHHAQALVMAGWAKSHGASPTVLTLTDRIINAQNDEIASMQRWLRDRHLPVPDADPRGMMMKMGGMEHEMLMPGMLTDAQMKQLDAARGKDFDRLFLTFMIQHHQGAVSMVTDLFATNGAAQDATFFKVASDISADQSTEIDRMQKMLASLVFGVSPQ
jgi:uncharacterized protein (DUF305 family)